VRGFPDNWLFSVNSVYTLPKTAKTQDPKAKAGVLTKKGHRARQNRIKLPNNIG